MADLPIPTPAQARKIWESMTNPSTRRVATKLRQAGLSVSHMRVARWRNRGWRPAAREDHPLEAALRSLNDAVPVLTSDPNATAKAFVEEGATEHEKLEQLTDRELLTRAVRELAITGIMISRALQEQVDALVPTKVGELAVLVRALAASLKAVTAGFKQAVDMRPGNPGEQPQADKSGKESLETAWALWDQERASRK